MGKYCTVIFQAVRRGTSTYSVCGEDATRNLTPFTEWRRKWYRQTRLETFDMVVIFAAGIEA